MPQTEMIYEIHITVNHGEDFVDDCYSFGVKPVIIDMGEGVPSHAMTSSTVRGDDNHAHAMANTIAGLFKNKGYVVSRVKIETVPWHPKADDPNPDQYFETHYAISLPCDEELLKLYAKNFDLHYSRNALKKGEARVQMLTYRRYTFKTAFEAEVDIIKDYLEQAGFVIDKVINEFALYDTNTALDNQWMNRETHV